MSEYLSLSGSIQTAFSPVLVTGSCSKRKRIRVMILLGTLTVLVGLGMSACGGSGKGSVTPAPVANIDLMESGVAVVGGSLASGGTIQVSDTATNQGTGSAGVSSTSFYLNNTPVKGGFMIGTRAIGNLATGTNSVSASTVFSLPLNLTGQYYVVACANDNNSVVESNTANNCAASTLFSVAGADLTVTAVSTNPAAALPSGTMLAIADSTADAIAAAGTSSTRYYLSQTPSLVKTGTGAGLVLGTRTVPALAASATSVGNVNVTIPTSTAAGNYYVFACANDDNTVTESNVNNNCASTPVVVYAPMNTVLIDPYGIDSVSCGLAASPCKTINYAVNTAATVKTTTVLINPGTYVEQVNLNKSLTLLSPVKYGAVIQAPATALTLDANGYANIVRIGGGVTAVLSGLTVQGPGPSGCGSLHYGIYVADADATITDSKILSIRDSSYSGCQNGVAIRFGSTALGYVGHTGTISNNIVLDYQKGGIVVDGLYTNVTVTGNTVTGQNTPGVNGQNGMQISRGAKATVTNNTVTKAAYFVACSTLSTDTNYNAHCNVNEIPQNNQYGPKNSSAAGILLYDVNGGVTLAGNTVTGNDIGVWISGDGPNTTNGSTSVLVKSNTVNNNRAAGILVDVSSTRNMMYGNTAHLNGTDALGNIVGFVDGSFPQGYGYDLVDENSDPALNDWGDYGAQGAVPSTFDTKWGPGKGALLNY